MRWIRRLFERLRTPSGWAEVLETRVEVDKDHIRCLRPDGTVHEVRWDELQSVAVETNDAGPFFEDVYYLLSGPEYSFYVPQCAQAHMCWLSGWASCRVSITRHGRRRCARQIMRFSLAGAGMPFLASTVETYSAFFRTSD